MRGHFLRNEIQNSRASCRGLMCVCFGSRGQTKTPCEGKSGPSQSGVRDRLSGSWIHSSSFIYTTTHHQPVSLLSPSLPASGASIIPSRFSICSTFPPLGCNHSCHTATPPESPSVARSNNLASYMAKTYFCLINTRNRPRYGDATWTQYTDTAGHSVLSLRVNGRHHWTRCLQQLRLSTFQTSIVASYYMSLTTHLPNNPNSTSFVHRHRIFDV